MTYWKKVGFFTDEWKIKISGSDGRVFVWRRSAEEWMPTVISVLAQIKLQSRR